MTDFKNLFDEFTRIRVGIIGDVMLDTYWWGHVERISPEAPVPVVTLDKKEYRIGGAGNVALNLASLGAQVSFFSVIGPDDEGAIVKELLAKNNIGPDKLLTSPVRMTTNKARIISRNQQMLRLDSETTHDLSAAEEGDILQSIQAYIEDQKPQVFVLEDYNKGVLTQRVIKETISLCKRQGILTAADPKRRNFFAFQNVDIFKPNLKEVKDGLNLLIDDLTLENMQQVHVQLVARLHHGISLITLSEKGIFYQQNDHPCIIPSHLRNVADVSGAGDTVIAVAALAYAATQDVRLMAEIANVAGGLVCEQVGTVAIDKNQLLDECDRLLKEV